MLENTLLNNRYELLDTIGIGGMAHVYKAYDKLLKRYVAIKILKEDYSQSQDFLDKFKLEATSAASLSDENIVGIYDVGSETIDGKKIEYIVMEMIEGTTLKTIIDEKAPLSNEKIIYYAKQIALALQAAHRKGVIHRDIKPANILINKDDKVKVADFGIARVSSQATITYTSSILGTVHYISPEQVKGMLIDNRSDLYSLGVVLYEMATGDVPFDAESPVSIAIKHLQDQPKNISEINPNIDPNLEKIINKLLSKDAAYRYQTATELISNLDNYKSINIDLADKRTQKITRETIKNNKVEYVSEKKLPEEEKNKKKSRPLLWILIPIIAAFLIYVSIVFLDDLSRKSKEESLISVPNVYEFTQSDAIERLTEANLSPEIGDRVNDNKIPEGAVVRQSVEANKKVEPGTVVKLTISSGPKLIRVPKVTGLSLEEAKEELTNAGFVIRTISNENSPRSKGSVISQTPTAYSNRKKGTEIDLVVSLGEEEKKTLVPNIKGQDQSIAINTLYERDLLPGQIDLEYSEQTINTVISQSIVANTEVKPGTAIDFVVSKGPEPQEEPAPPAIEGGGEENNPDEKTPRKFVFTIEAPEGAKEFNIKIYNLVPEKKIIYNQNFTTANLKDNKAVVEISAYTDSKFEVLLDDKAADITYE
ncbi:MAG: Stk1 family PASTA domain-containing Ser/Thr kinase [Tissierellia bacterium]|nr:Stk1 family PASTA domain-containing Ser/Thr kinase [Tissierellia bacterium]